MRTSRIPSRTVRTIGLLAVATILVPIRARADDPPKAEAALDEALKAALALDPSRVKDELLLDVGRALASVRRFDEARRAAEAINIVHWPPYVFMAIAEKQAEAGDVASAVRTADAINDPQQPQYRDDVIGRIALKQANAGDLKGAIETIRLCRRPEMWVFTIRALIKARAEAGDFAGALAVASSFKAPEFPPHEKALALAGVARLLAARGDIDAAERLARDEDEKKGAPLILAAVAEGRASAGDLEGAAGFARRVLDEWPDWETEARCRVVLIRDLAARGAIDEARRINDEPWKKPVLTRADRWNPPSLVPYQLQAARAIAGARAQRGDAEGACAALAGLPVHTRVLALIDLADRRARDGDRAAADRLLTVAERSAEVGGLGFYYQDLGAAEFRFGRRDASRASFAKAMHARDIGTPENLRAIVITQFRAGDRDGALQSIATIEQTAIRDQARAWIAGYLARQGEADAALEALRPIDDRMIRATALAQLAIFFADAGDRDRAVATCRRAAETAGSDGPPPSEPARIIAHVWASTAKGFPEAQAWSRRLANAETRASALAGVAQGALGRPLQIPPRSPYLLPMPLNTGAPPNQPGAAARPRPALEQPQGSSAAPTDCACETAPESRQRHV